MAKDKDQQQQQQTAALFSGADDKAITFQRAVFIVCNLKRIIRRPKKDSDKYLTGAAANSRKKSGDLAAEDANGGPPFAKEGAGPEGGPGGHHAGGRGLRFRNPIRRAFTLPTILCGSFALSGPAQRRLAQANDDDDDDDDEEDQQEEEGDDSEQSSDEQQDEQEAGSDSCDPEWRRTCSRATGRPPTSGPTGRGDESDFYTLDRHEGQREQAGRPRLRFRTPDGDRPLKRSPARRRRRPRREGVARHQVQDRQPLGSAFDCDPSSASSAADERQALGSLSCLVTPIRRAGGRTSFKGPQVDQLRLGDCHGNINSDPHRTLAALELQRQRQTTFSATLGLAGESQAPDRQQAAGQPRQTPICCPIWALAMELLDASQSQPRDQARHAHLLGAPPSSACLPAPVDPEQTQSREGSRQETGSCELANLLPDIQVQSGEFQQREARSDHDDDDDDERQDQEPHGQRSGPRELDEEAKSQEQQQQQSSESINEQMMGRPAQRRAFVCGAEAPAGSDFSPRGRDAPAGRLGKAPGGVARRQDEASARLRMKRFSSSALCLNEDSDQAKGSPSTGGLAQRDRKSSQGKPVEPTKAGAKSSSKFALGSSSNSATATPKKRAKKAGGGGPSPNSLAPTLELDPIVQYARQRRPSVSNQGSLNVDQQALFSAVECNQLERVKSILDEGQAGKVNVNSLNGDKLTCLDVAVLLRNLDMVRLLQQYKAKESSAYLTSEGRENQLYALYMEARRLVEDLSRSIEAITTSQPPPLPTGRPDQPPSCGELESICQTSLSSTGLPVPAASAAGAAQADPQQQQQQQRPPQLMLATGSLLSSALFEEKQRQLQYWRRRLDLFMQMRYGFEKLKVPNVPELVVLQVVGENSLGVKIVHSLQFGDLQPPAPPVPQADFEQPGGSEGNAQTGARRPPLEELVRKSHERQLFCPQAAKCSHAHMDEFVAFRRQLEQFQMPSSEMISGGGATEQTSGQTKKGSNQGRTEFATVRTARAAPQTGSAREKQAERLAVFNHLLAQQLALLSSQQRQQQQLDLLNSLRFKQQQQQQVSSNAGSAGPAAHKPQNRPHQLLLAHQVESTDSAYDNLAAAAASSRQQHQPAQLSQMISVQPSGISGAGGKRVNLVNFQKNQPPVAYSSLAYQLMSAKRLTRGELEPEVADGPGMCPSRSMAKDLCQAQGPQQPPPQLMLGTASSVGPSPAPITTKYKVEWSTNSRFSPISGSMIVYNTNTYPLECQIEELENGRPYFVRVASGNHKGFSAARRTTPTCLAPSSWRQVLVGGGSSSSSSTGAQNANQAPATSQRKRSKYDEEVFRKFTKLILLNKHILDENQVQMLQREQQNLLMSSSGRVVDSRSLLKSANLQNKSSLINMLLLDATMPSASDRSARTRNAHANSQPGHHLTTGNDLGQFHLLAGSSPRGSLYPSSTSTRASVTGSGGGSANDSDSFLNSSSASEQQQQQQQTSLKVRKNLKSFFQSSSAKFNKLNNQNKRGLYLATVIYSRGQVAAGGKAGEKADDCATGAPWKLVVTNDDRIPVIEIMNDLVAPSSLMGDFYWLLKINGTNWIDIKRLRQQLAKSHSSSTLHLRIKLLGAIEQMQVALGLEDIGRLFYKPIQAHDGSIVICTCKCVASTKQVSNLSIKWTSQHKIIPRNLRKISDTINLTNQQRERQQEFQHQQQMQMRRSQQLQLLQLQQQQVGRNSTSSGGGGVGPSHQFQPVNKRHSSSTSVGAQDSSQFSNFYPAGNFNNNPASAMSGQMGTMLMMSQLNPIISSASSSAHSSQDQLTATSCTSSTTTSTTATQSATQSSTQANFAGQPADNPVGQNQNQPNRLLAPEQANLAGGQLELGRLCESCQAALIQRRCTMASGSSSSSLASNESQHSWSSSQFSLASMNAACQRSCTCSRSNSAAQVLPAHQAFGPAATPSPQQQQQVGASSNSLGLAGAGMRTGSHMLAASAPASQRNSTQSARSASGSMSMMMMMMMMGGGNGPAGAQGGTSGGVPANQGQLQQQQQQTGTATQANRQTQSQQMNEANCPQKSSTYLMLASLSLYELLLFHLGEIIEFDQTSTRPLARGLYLGFIQLQTTVESMRLLVPRRRPNMVPCARIRDNAHVSREEWDLLKRFSQISGQAAPAPGSASSGRTSADQKTPTNSNNRQRQYRAGAGASPNRSSDPAIWSSRLPALEPAGEFASASGAAESRPAGAPRNTDGNHDEQAQLGDRNLLGSEASAGGFERDRAKSVSPGLINCAAGAGSAARAHQVRAGDAHAQASERLAQPQEGLRSSAHSGSCTIAEARRVAPPGGGGGGLDHNLLQETSGVESQQTQQHAHSETDLANGKSNSLQTGLLVRRQAANEPGACGGGQVVASDSNLIGLNRTAGRAEEAHRQHHQVAGQEDKPPGWAHRKRPSVGSLEQSPEMTFVRLIGDAARRLLSELKSQLPKHFAPVVDPQGGGGSVGGGFEELVSILNSLNDEQNNRIYHLELIELSNQVTFVLLIPAPENVCPVTSHDKSNILANNRDHMLLPLQIFETIHLATYEPDLLGKYSRLSTILETDLIVAQHEHRQAFSSHELKSTKSRVSHLQDMVAVADEFWRQLRWIVDVVSFARDKSQFQASGEPATGGCVRVGAIWRYFDQLACASSSWSAGAVAVLEEAAGPPGDTPPRREDLDECRAAATCANFAGSSAGQQAQTCELARTSSEWDFSVRGAHSRASEHETDSSTSRQQVKRTSSAKSARGRCKAGEGGAGPATARPERPPRLPKIRLPSGENVPAPPPGRRHSEQGPGERPPEVELGGDQAHAAGLADSGARCEHFEESILELQFGPALCGGRGVDAQQDQDSCRTHSTMGQEDEEAIYAYHISLRDATRQRKSSREMVSALVDEASSQTGALASTCGGLNLDRRQFERFAAVVSASQSEPAAASELLACGEFALDAAGGPARAQVTAYKFKRCEATNAPQGEGPRDVPPNSAHDANQAPDDEEFNGRGPASEAAQERRTRAFKSTNPFLTDSFDL